MKHHIFISYPILNQDIVENLADRLKQFGIDAWVYSNDRTLAADLWTEIEEKIAASELFIFVASKSSRDAQGQHRELTMALEKIGTVAAQMRAFPVLLEEVSFRDLPVELSNTNGVRMSAFSVQSTAFHIVKTFFPELLATHVSHEWIYPRPGQWLEVCQIDPWIEQYFSLGDRVYFRRISPLGLFECYSPELGELFWFGPRNLRTSDVVDENGELEREKVPHRYRYFTAFECEQIGFKKLKEEGRLK